MKTKLLVSGVVVVLAAAAAYWFITATPRPNFDNLGGVVMAYKFQPNETADAKLLVESVQRRLDFAGLDYVRVQALPDNEIEIRVPKTEQMKKDIEQVAMLVSQQGVLEFRILANDVDDKEAIVETSKLINEDTSALELQKLAEEGKPPPAPTNADGTPKLYLLKLPRGARSRVGYSWLEIGPQERHTHRLDNASQNDPERMKVWQQMAGNKRGTALQMRDADGRKILMGGLLYSRVCAARSLPEVERDRKKFEYFVLARTPETVNPDDPSETKATASIDGRYMQSATATVLREIDQPAVDFTMNAEGGKLFSDLTRKNVPTGDGDENSRVKRLLAIVLDGQMITAPAINSEIGARGVIAGNFIKREVDALAHILRSGALPAKVNAVPVRVDTVEPQKK